jgi:hypothetical protein
MQAYDDTSLRAAMREYLLLADRLDAASRDGEPPRELVDLADAKAVAGMLLRKRLADLGWTVPAALPAQQPQPQTT